MTYLVKYYLEMSVMLTVSIIFFVSCTFQFQHPVIEEQAPERVVVGYVTSWSDRMPDPSLVTHLIMLSAMWLLASTACESTILSACVPLLP